MWILEGHIQTIVPSEPLAPISYLNSHFFNSKLWSSKFWKGDRTINSTVVVRKGIVYKSNVSIWIIMGTHIRTQPYIQICESWKLFSRTFYSVEKQKQISDWNHVQRKALKKQSFRQIQISIWKMCWKFKNKDPVRHSIKQWFIKGASSLSQQPQHHCELVRNGNTSALA